MTEEIFSNISSDESLDNDLPATAARNEERDGAQTESNAEGNRSAPQDGRSRLTRRINEMGNMRSRQIALNASLESDRSDTSSLTPNPNTTTTTTTRVLALCCFVCSTPIATASDLLPNQIPRLETASYPYKLDLLIDDTETDPSISMMRMPNNNTNGGECTVYSATNPDGTRFDVARFGKRACRRVRVQGDEPTLDHTFFPPHPWSMASCRNCGVHLGWSFGGGNNEDMNETMNGRDEEGGSFLGLILTKLRERRIDATVLEMP